MKNIFKCQSKNITKKKKLKKIDTYSEVVIFLFNNTFYKINHNLCMKVEWKWLMCNAFTWEKEEERSEKKGRDMDRWEKN